MIKLLDILKEIRIKPDVKLLQGKRIGEISVIFPSITENRTWTLTINGSWYWINDGNNFRREKIIKNIVDSGINYETNGNNIYIPAHKVEIEDNLDEIRLTPDTPKLQARKLPSGYNYYIDYLPNVEWYYIGGNMSYQGDIQNHLIHAFDYDIDNFNYIKNKLDKINIPYIIKDHRNAICIDMKYIETE